MVAACWDKCLFPHLFRAVFLASIPSGSSALANGPFFDPMLFLFGLPPCKLDQVTNAFVFPCSVCSLSFLCQVVVPLPF